MTGEQTAYGHNAIKADGSLDPNGTFNVLVVRLKEVPTASFLVGKTTEASQKGASAQGWQVSPVTTLPLPSLGAEFTFHDPSANVDGASRMFMIDDVFVLAIFEGDVGTDGLYFLNSFQRD